jgi:hypothetical protein
VGRTPTVPSVSAPTEARHVIALHRAQAEVALLEATAGQPTCRANGSGIGRVKRSEGRLAAIAELQRALRSGPADVQAISGRVIDRWRRESERRAGRGAAWDAFYAGGLGELDALSRELHDLGRLDGRASARPDPAPSATPDVVGRLLL